MSDAGLCPASTTASPGARQRATNASTRGFSSLIMASRTRIPSRICGISFNHNVLDLRQGRMGTRHETEDVHSVRMPQWGGPGIRP